MLGPRRCIDHGASLVEVETLTACAEYRRFVQNRTAGGGMALAPSRSVLTWWLALRCAARITRLRVLRVMGDTRRGDTV